MRRKPPEAKNTAEDKENKPKDEHKNHPKFIISRFVKLSIGGESPCLTFLS